MIVKIITLNFYNRFKLDLQKYNQNCEKKILQLKNISKI